MTTLRGASLSRSAGNKKWISATAVADYGDSQALWIPPLLPFQLGIAVTGASLLNRAGTDIQVGLGVRFPIALWAAGQVTAAGAFTDDTTDAQDEGTNDFPMHDRADSGSGFMISCDVPFNTVGVVQGVAGDQTTPVNVVEYWNGSSWVDITAGLLINDVLSGSATERIICFAQPSNWAVGGSGTGVSATRYNLRLRVTHSGAGTTNPVASQIFIGYSKLHVESLDDNTFISLFPQEYQFPPQGDALFPLFSTASFGNEVEVGVRGY